MTASPLYFGPRFAFPECFFTLMLFCLSMLAFKVVLGAQSYTNTECGRVIKDELQTMKCLNNSNIDITSPVVLESTVEGNEFICPNKPPLYTFRCTLYNDDLIWLFNNTRVTAFLNDDRVGRIFSTHYPDSDPIYNITAVLTQVKTVSRYNTTYCVSIMTVEAYDETVVDVKPFTVSCQTFCKDENNTAVCQLRHYNVAAKPSKMTHVSGNIQKVSAADTSGVASVKWTPPTNENETVIDYYNVTLIGSHTNNSILIDKDTSLQTYSYSFGVADTNYSAVNVEAMDICGQIGEPLQSVLKLTASTGTFSNPSATDGQQPVIGGLAAAFTIMTVITIILAIFVTTLIILRCRKSENSEL